MLDVVEFRCQLLEQAKSPRIVCPQGMVFNYKLWLSTELKITASTVANYAFAKQQLLIVHRDC